MNQFEVKPDALPQAGEDMTAYLNSLFIPGSKAFTELAYEVQHEFRYGGSPDVRRMVLDRVNYNAITGTGSFRVVLDIDFSFGCEDLQTKKKDQTSEWSFQVDEQQATIIFNGSPYAEERSTGDEF